MQGYCVIVTKTKDVFQEDFEACEARHLQLIDFYRQLYSGRIISEP